MNLEKKIKQYINLLLERIKKVKKRTIYCVGIGLIMAVFSFFLNDNSIYINNNEIERSGYGSQKSSYNVTFDAVNLDKNISIGIAVSPKKYTIAEAEEVFKKKMEDLQVSILGENEDYEHVNKKLVFASDIGDGVRASYTFEPRIMEYDVENIATVSNIVASMSETSKFSYFVKYQNLVDGSGNVNNGDFAKSEICTGTIEIQLSTDVKEKETPYKSNKYLIPITIITRELSKLDSFKNEYIKEVKLMDAQTSNTDTIVLPSVVNGFKINYKDKRNFSFLLMPLFGVLLAFLLEARDREQVVEKIKRKKRLLEIDYSQIISKILLFVSSGMTIRNSMIRLAEQYIKSNPIEKRAAYEELVIVKNKLSSGYSETKAYEDMAKNLNMRIYTRFLNILIQSIRNGNKELKNILNMEVQDALYERKQHAKKLGEEASTKLVLPLMMMLAVIMIVIMVPAFMGM